MSYPQTPGYKVDGPSKDAALSFIAESIPLRARVFFAILTSDDGLTSDECAQKVGSTALAVRPRLSELLRDGEIEDAGIRRKNESGRNATVWRVVRV